MTEKVVLDFCHNLCSAALESATTFEAPEHVLPSDLFPLFPNNSIPAKVRMGWTFYVCVLGMCVALHSYPRVKRQINKES